MTGRFFFFFFFFGGGGGGGGGCSFCVILVQCSSQMGIYDRFTMASGCVPDAQDVFPIASRLVFPLPQQIIQ